MDKEISKQIFDKKLVQPQIPSSCSEKTFLLPVKDFPTQPNIEDATWQDDGEMKEGNLETLHDFNIQNWFSILDCFSYRWNLLRMGEFLEINFIELKPAYKKWCFSTHKMWTKFWGIYDRSRPFGILLVSLTFFKYLTHLKMFIIFNIIFLTLYNKPYRYLSSRLISVVIAYIFAPQTTIDIIYSK